MAKRRCIAVDVYESEEFLTLSDKAKVLYTLFILRSDDEGVVINPRTAMRLCGATDVELCELLEMGFLLAVDGVYVIRHWYAHNRIQPSRKTDTLYTEQISRLYVSSTKEYEFVDKMSTNC